MARDDSPMGVATRLAWSKGGRSIHTWPEDGLLTSILGHPKVNRRLNADQIQELRELIQRRTEDTRRVALSTSALPADVADRHDILTVSALSDVPAETLDQYPVVLVKAPMAAGKTQEILLPWIKRAWEQLQARTLLTCHRVSLVQNLVRRTRLSSYVQRPLPADDRRRGVVVCLPSLVRPDVVRAVPHDGSTIAVDEIAQVLRSLTSADINRTRHGGVAEVFVQLVNRISSASRVLVLDAHLDAVVLGFLEFCRPDERFLIVEQPPVDVGLTATFITSIRNRRLEEGLVRRILAELADGERVWVAVESPKLGAALAEVARVAGFTAIDVCAGNRLKPEQAALLADPDRVSQGYQMVVASPIIASGVSIEHRTGPRFTKFYYAGAGRASTPLEAIQQMGRVRYARHWTICIGAFTPGAPRTREQILRAKTKLALDEAKWHWPRSLSTEANKLDEWLVERTLEREIARGAFGAGIWFHLLEAKWTLTRGSGGARGDIITETREKLIARAIWELIDAPIIDEETARDIRREPQSSHEDMIAAEACRIRTTLGVLDLKPWHVEAFDEGRLISVIERFEDWLGVDAPEGLPDERGEMLAHRKNRRARRQLYADLCAGVSGLDAQPLLGLAEALEMPPAGEADILALLASLARRKGGGRRPSGPPPTTKPLAEQVLKPASITTLATRLTKVVDKAAEAGIIETSWVKKVYPNKVADKRGRPRKLNDQQQVEMVRQMVERMGLRMPTVSRERADGAGGGQVRHYAIDLEDLARMQELSTRRSSFTIDGALRERDAEAAGGASMGAETPTSDAA